ncbi:MAG TPA: hypothetical protein VG206_13715 [Terriglobia bacterium]|nr:hypothetical protein [Terriglobia bacterium]
MQGLTSLLDRIHAEEQARQTEATRFVIEHKMKIALAPRKWNELKRQWQETCVKLNASGGNFRYDERSPDEVAVVRLNSEGVVIGRVVLTFYLDIPVIICDISLHRQDRIGFRPIADDIVWTLNGANQPHTVIVEYPFGVLSGLKF